ncbi:MAG: phage tail tape measure protein, partial [Bacteroidales bacterium]|nr:phage tail tape measure protein [Bacteroidales bacterium]
MALDVSGSSSLYWKAGIDYSGMNADAAGVLGIIRRLGTSVARISPFTILGVGAGVAFGKAATESYKFADEFDVAMTKVRTISEATQANFAGISEEIINLSRSVSQSAPQLATAFYQITSSGFDGAEAMEILEQSAKGAIAGFTDTFTVADAATRIMNAYGKEAGTVENVLDKMFKTVELGVIEMDGLSH